MLEDEEIDPDAFWSAEKMSPALRRPPLIH
jgi:hypothetical protein